MGLPKLKTVVLLGLAGAWVVRNQKRLKAKVAEAKSGSHTLASLADDLVKGNADQTVPTAENPFPKSNPTMLPTGPGPGG